MIITYRNPYNMYLKKSNYHLYHTYYQIEMKYLIVISILQVGMLVVFTHFITGSSAKERLE